MLSAGVAAALALAGPASAAPPVASFTVDPATPAAGATATLTSTSTDPDKDALTANWDFDNNGTTDATGTTVTHAFTAASTVTLRVTDAAGESGSVSQVVALADPPATTADPAPSPTPAPPANTPPVAGFSVDPGPYIVGHPITFTSTSVDAQGAIAAERWDLNGDGRFNDASGPSVTWSFSTPGPHTVRLRVLDGAGAASTYQTSVYVDAPPIAAFSTAPSTVIAGDTVTFTSTSRDPDGSIAHLDWALDGDGAFNDGHDATTVTRKYPTVGVYVVQLQATDDRGATATTSVQVNVVADKPPLASFSVAPIAPVVGQSVQFTSRASDPDGSIAKLAWDLDGNGAFDNGAGTTATWTYKSAGDVMVQLRATDDRGVSSTAFQSIYIRGTVSPQDAPTAPSPGSSVPNARPLSSVPSPGAPLMFPFPIIRIRGQIVGGVVQISLLSVRAQRGARVVIRCRGEGCPRRRATGRIRSASQPMRVRSLEGRYRPGARLEVFVTMPGRIGKYVSFQMRRDAAPLRRDRCIGPRGTKPSRCPG